MCTGLNIRVKAVNSSAPRVAYVPCGQCAECRRSSQYAWSFRLSAEFEAARKKGWNIGFFTLTYDDEHLPHLPLEVFSPDVQTSVLFDGVSLPHIQCFDRTHVRKFIDNIRKHFWRDSKTTALKYMVCSELGASTQRSHYHGLIAFPPDVDARDMFDKIHDYWIYGHVFPRYFDGGLDKHGYEHKPFLVSTSSIFAAQYAAKYCTKDLDFLKSVEENFIDTSSKLFKRYDCFHIQSRSLGLGILADMTDAEKLDAYTKGIYFLGSDSLHRMPTYLRNKIVFDNWYTFEYRNNPHYGEVSAGPDVDTESRFLVRRLVRRKANDFFQKNFRQIYDEKKKFFVDVFTRALNVDFWSARGSSQPELIVQSLSSALSRDRSVYADICDIMYPQAPVSIDSIVDYYLSAYGVLDTRFYSGLEPCKLWFNRYYSVPKFTSATLDSQKGYQWHKRFCDVLVQSLTRSSADNGYNSKRADAERNAVARVGDFFKSAI